MAFPSLAGTQPNTLSEAWETAREIATQVKQQAQDAATNAANGLSGRSVVGLSGFMAAQFATLGVLAAVPGLAAYAQAQMNNSLDVAGAFTAMRTAMTNVINWILTNFPKDASGNLLFVKLDASGNPTYTVFPSGQLTQLVTLLNALIATID